MGRTRKYITDFLNSVLLVRVPYPPLMTTICIGVMFFKKGYPLDAKNIPKELKV